MPDLLDRITVNPAIFGGKPIIRGHRLAVEHILGMLAAGDDVQTIVEGYPWMERDDVLAAVSRVTCAVTDRAPSGRRATSAQPCDTGT